MASDHTESGDNGTRDICVAIDPGSVDPRSLEMAVLLAERLKRGLRGLLVSPSSLHSVAQLPFTTEVVRTTGEERELLAEVLELQHRQKRARVQRLLEEQALHRRIRFRVESVGEEDVPIGLLLAERQDVLLPPTRRRFAVITGSAADNLRRVKWVYDDGEESRRALELLLQLVAAGQISTVYLIATCGVPRQLLAQLSAAGVRVCWVNVRDDRELLYRIKSGPEADLTLVPGNLVARIGEDRLAAVNRETVSPVLIIA